MCGIRIKLTKPVIILTVRVANFVCIEYYYHVQLKKISTYKGLLKLCLLFAVSLMPLFGYSQFIVGEGFSAKVLVDNVLVGEGVETRNIKFTGHPRAIGLFENGTSADLGLDKGIILSTGVAAEAKGPNSSISHTHEFSFPGNKTLDKIAGAATEDAAVLEFEFKPQTEEIEFTYIFASDEYPEWVDRGYNDVFGFFISGPGITGEQNVAKLPGSNIEVTIDNVNHKRNTQFYQSNETKNTSKHKYLQHDGQTTVLKANLTLQPCQWYTIKLAIADVGDAQKDSWVFIGSKSFKHKTGVGEDTSFCSENFVQTLDAGHPGRDVLWSTSEKTQQIQVKGYGKYWVRVYTDCGSFKDEVNIFPAIDPISIGNDTMICGNEVDQVLEVKNRVFETYKWSNGDTTPTMQVKKPGRYWLTVGRNGCYASDTMEIEDIPIPDFTIGNDTFICGDIDLTLKPNVPGDEYTWNDGSKAGAKKVNSPGVYWLRIDEGICYSTDTVSIGNRTAFTIDIGPPTLSYCETKDVRLTTGITDTSVYKIDWNTGAQVGAITINETGTYTVLVQDKECGFNSYDEVDVAFLSENLNYYVPNAFSPNSDELNETVKPIFGLSEVDEFRYTIYNRWGQKVFETHELGKGWDGMWNGQPAPPGVYIWYSVIKTDCLPDQKRYQKGTLTVLR